MIIQRLSAFGMATAVVTAFTLWACTSGEVSVTRLPESTQVRVETVKRHKTGGRVSVSGILEADKTAVLNFLVPGKVDKVYVDEGDHVEKGQVLARVEPDHYVSELEIAEAVLLRAQDAFDRFEPLVDEGAFSESSFIEFKSGLMQANAARDIVQKRLNDTELRSPFTGIVGMKAVEIGEVVSPQAPAFMVVKTDVMVARLAVPESEIGLVNVGSAAEVRVQALDNHAIPGTVALIGAVAEPQTRTYTVEVALGNPEFLLRPGMIANASVSTMTDTYAITVPAHAIVRDADNLTYVFTVDTGSGRVERRRVMPGGVVSNAIEIISGLEQGEIIVTAGLHKLHDGSPVLIKGS